jgi:hypothetical protein
MGKKRKKPSGNLTYDFSRMMVPNDFLEYFEVAEIIERPSEWQVILHEKAQLVPAGLKGVSDVVLDGYCNPIQLLSHCFTLKPVYLVMKRRRWKEGGTDKHYSNGYTLTKDASKLTPDMAGFLKI